MIREHRYEWDVLYIKCPKCWERKPIDAFSKNSKRTFWIQSKCKECHRKYHIANKEKIKYLGINLAKEVKDLYSQDEQLERNKMTQMERLDHVLTLE